MSELTAIDKQVFGADAERHPITGLILERGSGALPEKQQAELHCRTIDAEQGRAAGNEMRRQIGLPIAEEIAAAAAKAEAARKAREKRAYETLAEKEAAETVAAAAKAAESATEQ